MQDEELKRLKARYGERPRDKELGRMADAFKEVTNDFRGNGDGGLGLLDFIWATQGLDKTGPAIDKLAYKDELSGEDYMGLLGLLPLMGPAKAKRVMGSLL